jgi:hypothetical protein
VADFTMRQRFEDWARREGYVVQYSYGAYWDQDTERAWRIWQAADEAAQVAYGVSVLRGETKSREDADGGGRG